MWHGLLTTAENRYVEKQANLGASGKIPQNFIDEIEGLKSALIAASEDGCLTILPLDAKINVLIDMGDSGVIDTADAAKETELYKMPSEADGFLSAKGTLFSLVVCYLHTESRTTSPAGGLTLALRGQYYFSA